MYTYQDIKKTQAENVRISTSTGVSHPMESGFVAPQSWIDYTNANAPKLDKESISSSDRLNSLLNGVVDFGKSLAKPAAALSDIGRVMMAPARALGESVKIDPTRALVNIMTGGKISGGVSINKSNYIDNLVKDVAEKTSYEQVTGENLIKDDGTIDWKVGRGFMGSAMEAPIYAYGGGKGLQTLMSKEASLGAKILGNAAVGLNAGGMQGLIETIKSDNYNRPGSYIVNVLSNALSGAVIGAATTGAFGLPGALAKQAKIKPGLLKMGVSQETLSKLTGKEARELYTALTRNEAKSSFNKANRKTIENFAKYMEYHKGYSNGDNTELVSVDELIKYREFDRASDPISKTRLDSLRKDISENGIKEPIIINYGHNDKIAVIGEGNHRLAIAKELGIDAIPTRISGTRASKAGQISGNKGFGNVKGVIADEFGYVPSDMSPSQIGIKTHLSNTVDADKLAREIIAARPAMSNGITSDSPVVNELATKIKNAYATLPDIASERSAITSRRLAAGRKAVDGVDDAITRAKIKFKSMEGKYDLNKAIDKIELDKGVERNLRTMIEDNLSETDQFGAQSALNKLIKGEIPYKSEVDRLSEALNFNLGHIIEPPTGLQKLGQKFIDAGDFARSILSSGDVSMIGRQAFPAMSQELLTHPIETAKMVANSLKYITDEQYYVESMAKHASHPQFNLFKDNGLDLTKIGGNVSKNREQTFASSLAERWAATAWFVKPSERQAVGFLNDIRMKQAERMYGSFIRNGLNPEKLTLKELNAARELINTSATGINKLFKVLEPLTEQEYKEINARDGFRAGMDLVNAATGRGATPKMLENYSKALDTSLFSSKLVYRNLRYLNPLSYVDSSIPETVKKAQAQQLASMIVTATTFLSLAKAAGAEVEMDPRSSKFAKAKFGNTTIDLTGGFQPYLRTAVQLATQQTATASGGVKPMGEYGGTSASSTAFNFVRGKLNPLLAAGADFTFGENVVGEPMNIPKIVSRNIAPLAWKDAFDAILASEDKDVFNTLGFTTASAVGFGMQTDDSEVEKAKKDAEKQYVQDIKRNGGALSKDYLKYKLIGK